MSMIRFTHSIWMTVRGSLTPMNGPSRATPRAATLIVSWNRMNRWMFSYRDRPQRTALMIVPNESSRRMMSLASLAAAFPVRPIARPTFA